MNYTVSDVKNWAIVFLEENNFFMAYEASRILLHTPTGQDIPNDLIVHTVYTEYLKIMNMRSRNTIKIDREENINLTVRIKDNQIIEAYMTEEDHEE